jgi:Zn-dependent protease/CBS domain-containing protein
MRWSWKIGSILGIPVRVHFTFLLLLVLIFFAGNSFIGIGGVSGVVFVILVFGSVVAHELSHSMVARYFGIEVVDITLLPIGGVARMPMPASSPKEEILISIAGPIASLALAFSLWFLARAFGSSVTLGDFSVYNGMLAQLAAVNIVLALFNLVPAFPMDGGRILRGVLALYLRPFTATRIAVGVGQVFAILMFFYGLMVGNFMMVLIALFVYMGAETEERQVGIMMSLGHATANSAMIRHVDTLSPTRTVGDAAEMFAQGFQSDFPIIEDRRLVGLVTREALLQTLHQQGPSVLLSQIMIRDFPTALEDTPLIDILGKIEESGIKAAPVMKGAELRGMVTLEQIGRYNMLCAGYSCEFLDRGVRAGS